MKINYGELFSKLCPGFFDKDYIRNLPAEHILDEQVLNLHTWMPGEAIACPPHITFGRYTGELEALHDAIREVDEDWVQWFASGERVFCAYDAGQVVSFCILDDFGEYEGLRIGAPGCVGTIPSHRKQGIGLRMIQLATEELQKDGYDLSWIHYTAVGHWYAKLGYQTVVKWNSQGIVSAQEGDISCPRRIAMLINAKDVLGHIRPEIYGHFAEHLGRCIYGGIFAGEDSAIPNEKGIRKDVVEAFRHIKVPTIRWPGGCFAEEYHWQDGIGPKDARKKMVNINWGAVVEDNSFGTHEYMELCRQVGCKPYINANMGAGTVQEMAEWVEYMTAEGTPLAEMRKTNGHAEPWKVPFLGVGNENWGCGGEMTPETYAAEFRRYAAFCREYNGNHLCRIACGPSSADYGWMETVMKSIAKGWGGYPLAGGIDLHYYTMPIHPQTDSATEFDDDLHYATMDSAFFADELITRHSEIMNRYDPENKVGLIIGEWGCWHQVEPGTNPGFLYQQNTMRDALVAAIHLNIFNKHSRRVMMANLAQTVNVLQSILLTDGDKLVKTPTYHVFDLYKAHQDGTAVYCYVDDDKADHAHKAPMVSASVSIKEGVLTLTMANCSLTEEAAIACDVCHFAGAQAEARILHGDTHAFNDFDHPEDVVIQPYTADYADGKLNIKLPPCAVVEVTIQ